MSASHLPTAEELTDAIASILHEEKEKELDVKYVRDRLLQEHADWRVPERRVHKFVKRQRNSLGPKEPRRNVFKGLSLFPFVGGKRAESPEPKDAATTVTALTNIEQSPQRSETQSDLTDDIGRGVVCNIVPETVTTNNPEETNTEVSVATPVDVDSLTVIPEVDSKAVNVFDDDNEGKKVNSCAPCEGCLIL